MPNSLDPAKQLKVARLLISGARYKDVIDQTGVARKTVQRYRALLFDGLEARGITLMCSCDKPLGHKGWCTAGREPSPDNPTTDDGLLCELLNEGLAEPQPKKKDAPTADEQLAQKVGFYHGRGESLPSIRTRLGINEIRFERLPKKYPRAWGLGIKQGEDEAAAAVERRRLAAEREEEEKREPVPEKKRREKRRAKKRPEVESKRKADETLPDRADAEETRTDPDRSDATVTTLATSSSDVEKEEATAGVDTDSGTEDSAEYSEDALGGIPWAAVIADLQARRAALQGRIDQIDQHIDSCRLLEQEYS